MQTCQQWCTTACQQVLGKRVEKQSILANVHQCHLFHLSQQDNESNQQIHHHHRHIATPPLSQSETLPVALPTEHLAPLSVAGPSTSTPVLTSPKTQPFTLKLLMPNIKICAGWRLGYQPRTPPYDICIVHPETRQILNQATGCMMTVGINAHYHVGTDCIKFQFPDFDPSQLIIPKVLRDKLLSNPHAQYSALISQELGITL